jgi:type I restriction enzyme, S subunit
MPNDLYPDGWKLVKLSDLGEVNRGRSRHRPRYAEHLYGGPYPFVQTGDIKASGGRITEYQQTYSEAGLAQSRLWPAKTLCITIAANIAETGLLAFPACFPDSVIGFIADETKANVYFVEYMFRHLKRQLQREASGSVQDNINIRTLERLRFPIPGLQEQKAIAAVLSAFDDKIELNRQMNATLEEMARALFKSGFVDFDPVRRNQAGQPRQPYDHLFPDRLLVDGNGREVPEGWQIKPLDEIAHYQNGLALQKFPPEGKDYLPVIKIRELRQGFADANSNQASPKIKESCILDDGDVVFSWSGSLLVDLWCAGKGALNQHLFKVTSETHPKWFYYFWTKHYLDEFQRIAAGKATTMGHIQRKHLTAAITAVPPKDLLDAMSQIMQPLVEQIIVNRLESRTLADLRDALLPRLMSGRLRVLTEPEARLFRKSLASSPASSPHKENGR